MSGRDWDKAHRADQFARARNAEPLVPHSPLPTAPGGASNHLRAQAHALALDYHGQFPFMVTLAAKCRQTGFLPSGKQAQAILRCHLARPHEFEPI